DLEAAGLALEALQKHQEGDPFVIAREVQWQVARVDRDAAAAALGRLCAAPEQGSEWPWQAADRAFREAGWRGRAEAIYLATLAEPGTAAPVGEHWVRHWADRKRWKEARRLKSLLARGGPAARRALGTYVTILGEGRHTRRLSSCLRKYREVLRAETYSWAVSGNALANQCRYRDAVRWMADWRDRPDTACWMFTSLVSSLRALGRDAEGHALSLHALGLPADESAPEHIIWLALDELIAGCPGAMAARVEGIDTAGFHPKYRFLRELALVLIEAQRREGRSRAEVARAVRRAIQRLRRETPIHQALFPSVLPIYRAAARRLARTLGPWHGTWMWVGMLAAPPLSR
ncbi:MAG: hypothetical protein U0790_04820, partial [Isosphaeraceae bacterium]